MEQGIIIASNSYGHSNYTSAKRSLSYHNFKGYELGVSLPYYDVCSFVVTTRVCTVTEVPEYYHIRTSTNNQITTYRRVATWCSSAKQMHKFYKQTCALPSSGRSSESFGRWTAFNQTFSGQLVNWPIRGDLASLLIPPVTAWINVSCYPLRSLSMIPHGDTWRLWLIY